MGNACGVVLVNGEPPSDAEEELEETGTDESQPLATAAHSSRPSEPELPAPEGRAGDENKMAQKKWHKGQLLGEGSFGRVWMALDESSGELQAVKEVPLPAQSSEQAENAASQLQEEIALLQRIQHQNIVDYAGYQRLERSLCIFLRYVSGGSVASLLHSFGAFPERVVKNYSAQLARGLEFLHSNGVVHRDIKGSNALVTTSGVVKLADFGASKPLDQLISATSGFKSFRGTPHWMAPGTPVAHACSLATTLCSTAFLNCKLMLIFSSHAPFFCFFASSQLQRQYDRKVPGARPMSGAWAAL